MTERRANLGEIGLSSKERGIRNNRVRETELHTSKSILSKYNWWITDVCVFMAKLNNYYRMFIMIAKSTQQITVTALKPPPPAFKRKRIFSFALKITEFPWMCLTTTIEPKTLVLTTQFTVFWCSPEKVKHFLVNLTTTRTLRGTFGTTCSVTQFIVRNIGQVTSQSCILTFTSCYTHVLKWNTCWTYAVSFKIIYRHYVESFRLKKIKKYY